MTDGATHRPDQAMAQNPFIGPSVAARYATARPPLHVEALRRITTRVRHADRALDLGCGTGLSTRAARSVADLVVGVDSSVDMLREVDRAPGTCYVRGAAERIPFEDAAFDLVTIASAIHWFEPPALAEARRVLRSDGQLLVYDIWFRAEMTGQPGFHDWLAEISDERYPPVVKNPRPDLASIGFESVWKDDLHLPVAVTREALAEYLMTHSERIAAVAAGRESEAEQRRILLDGLTPFFQDATTRELAFGARIEMFAARG